MMTRFELRYVARHPFAWARRMWLHLFVSFVLATLAAAYGMEIFSQVPLSPVWPLLLSWVAGLVLATAIVPLDRVLLAVTGSAMMTSAILRMLALSEVIYVGTASRPVVVALMAKEGLLFALGASWSTWTRACGAALTVEAGWDDRGTERA